MNKSKTNWSSYMEMRKKNKEIKEEMEKEREEEGERLETQCSKIFEFSTKIKETLKLKNKVDLHSMAKVDEDGE